MEEELENNWFDNFYTHCGEEWHSGWSCMCNDRCPKCNAEIEPFESIDLSRPIKNEKLDWKNNLS